MSSSSISVIRLDSPEIIRKPHVDKNGWLYADAVFARDGILEYYRADGTKQRELRLPEENQKKHPLFGSVPLTLEHPPRLLTTQTAKNYARGFTLSDVFYDKGGFVRGGIMAFDQALIDGITKEDSIETSAGYRAIPAYLSVVRKEPGTWRGEPYDCIQEIESVNHVCTTRKGRAGSDVRVLMDSFAGGAYHAELAAYDPSYESQIKYFDFGEKKDMADTTNLKSIQVGRTEIKVDASDAALITAELDKYDSAIAENKELKEKIEALTSENSQLKETQDSLTSEKESLEGRSDVLSDICDSAIEILDEYGYELDEATQTFVLTDSEKADMKYKEDMKYKKDMNYKKKDMSEEEEDEELMDMLKKDMSEDEDEEEKKDSATIAGEIITALEEARTICPDLKFDSATMPSAIAVKRLALKTLNPQTNFDSNSDAWIEGRYSMVLEMKDSKNNQRPNYTDELKTVLDSAERNNNNRYNSGTIDEDLKKQRERADSAIQAPLTMSKKK